MKHEESCGAIIFIEKDKQRHFLVLQHRGGHWDFPKGHVEPDESEHQTAQREVKEETGLDITIIPGYREEITYSPGKGVEKSVTFFVAEVDSDHVKIQAKEISAFRWLPYQDARSLLSFDSAKGLLDKAVAFLKQQSL
ncbi:MAG TPA: bis(5'-nucleosyl)-tetraphosphatase [Candidatus Nanoarchaeia archaeon]|nr:bis(5'-nucleosyl)-tetraphosphatase [Candidatus Nanoarchaeia archaeon]